MKMLTKTAVALVVALTFLPVGFITFTSPQSVEQEEQEPGRWNVDYVKSNGTVGFIIMSRDTDGDATPDDLLVSFWIEDHFTSGSCSGDTCEVMGSPATEDEFKSWFDSRFLEIMDVIKKSSSLDHA